MDTISIMWTDQMQQALAELQQRPLLQHLLVFAEQRGVDLYTVGGTLRDICLGRHGVCQRICQPPESGLRAYGCRAG